MTVPQRNGITKFPRSRSDSKGGAARRLAGPFRITGSHRLALLPCPLSQPLYLDRGLVELTMVINTGIHYHKKQKRQYCFFLTFWVLRDVGKTRALRVKSETLVPSRGAHPAPFKTIREPLLSSVRALQGDSEQQG